MAKERAYREHRRQWLSLWSEEVGGPKRLADLTDTVDTHITAVLKGRRNVGDDLAEKMERKPLALTVFSSSANPKAKN